MERIAESRVEPEHAGVRLDLYLGSRFSYHSRNEWSKTIGNGEILVNGRAAKASRKLAAGDVIAYVPKEELKEPEVNSDYTILEEHDDWVGIGKPGNLPCHPAGVFFRNTLWYLLKERYGGEPHIATRLDRGTSGVVLVARNSDTAREFTNALQDGHRVQKQYFAIVHGKFDHEIQADGWLSPDPSARVNKKRRFTFEKMPEGETSSTLLQPVIAGDEFSLVSARPRTGRLHQIRTTLFSLGFPLVGDLLYGIDDRYYLKFVEDQLTEEDRKALILPRQALHAASLVMPFRGQEFRLVSPMPPDMQTFVNKIEKQYTFIPYFAE